MYKSNDPYIQLASLSMDVDGEEPVKGPETRPNGLIKAAIKGILSNRNNNDKPDGASVYKEWEFKGE